MVVGARFDAAYEIYAHIAVAEREGMKPERLAALVADLKPNDLTPDEGCGACHIACDPIAELFASPARRGSLRSLAGRPVSHWHRRRFLIEP